MDCAAHGRPGEPGQVVYFAPDSYAGMFWPTWQKEVAAVGLRNAINMWPPLFSKEVVEDVAGTSRSPVAMREQLSFRADFAGRFGLPDPGPLGKV